MCDVAYSGAPGRVADDGGPWTLEGVMSWGKEGYPIRLTRMEYYVDWINGL